MDGLVELQHFMITRANFVHCQQIKAITSTACLAFEGIAFLALGLMNQPPTITFHR